MVRRILSQDTLTEARPDHRVGISQSDVIGEQGNRKTAAKGDEIRDLMTAIGLQPSRHLCSDLKSRRLSMTGMGQIPFKRSAIQLVFVRRWAASK